MYHFLIPLFPVIMIILSILIAKSIPFIKYQFDVLSGGCYDPLYETLSVIYNHMQKNPNKWKFNSDFARFPKDGNMAIITISKEYKDDKFLSISISNVNQGKDIKLKSYFNKIFKKQINEFFSTSSTNQVINTLYPGEKHLLLTHSSTLDTNENSNDNILKAYY